MFTDFDKVVTKELSLTDSYYHQITKSYGIIWGYFDICKAYDHQIW